MPLTVLGQSLVDAVVGRMDRRPTHLGLVKERRRRSGMLPRRTQAGAKGPLTANPSAVVESLAYEKLVG